MKGPLTKPSAQRGRVESALKRAVPWLVPLAALLSCVPRDAGYEDVRKVVSRTGHDVRWRHVDPTGSSRAEVKAMISAPLTADAAVKLALLNNAELQAAFEELGMARGDLLRALRLPNPSVEGGLQYAADSSPRVELSVTQDLSELILLPMRNGVAQAELASVKLDVAGRAMDLILEVRKAFYGHLADQQILELRTTVLEALKASSTAAEEIHRAGNMTDLDLASQQVLYEEARVSYSSAETALATSRERLNALLGVWGDDTSWRASERLDDPEEGPTEDLEMRAVERSVELAAIRHRFSAAARRTSLARAQGLLPELKAGVAFEREGGGWGYGPVAEVEIPIFYQGQGEIARAQSEMRQQEQFYAATGVRVRAVLRAVQARASTARERALYLKNVLLPTRERILNDTQLQFNAMNASVFQLLIARRDQIETGRAYVEALREYWLAKADLEQLRAGRIPEGAMSNALMPITTAGASASGLH